MTDEEKAEERTHKEYCDNCFNNLCKRNMNDICFYSHTKDYLDGLAEGRKEQFEQDKKCCANCMAEGKVSDLEKENAELKKDKEYLDKVNNEQTEVILKLNEQIEKMKIDQKTAFDKGMKHLAKELKEYDRINGAWTDYFEHTVNKVLKWELERKGRTEWELAE